MKKLILSLQIAVWLIGNSDFGFSQTAFSENFDSLEINENLIVPGDYAIANGGIGAKGLRTDYIRTIGTSYNTIDFSMAITVNIDNNSDANGIAWIGIGSGLADPNWSYQPMNAGYAGLEPLNWGGGGFGIDYVAVPSELGALVANGTAQWNAKTVSTKPLGNTVRLEMTKSGDSLLFSLDPNYNNFLFNPVYSDSFSFSQNLPFLDDKNSSLFFGSGNGSTFSNFSVTTLPEPSTYVLFGIGAIGMLMVLRRKKTA
jgi:hypothetical protein